MYIVVLLFLVFVATPEEALGSCKPALPSVDFTNPPPDFNFEQNEFSFFYQGTDGDLTYKYTPWNNNSLFNIQCIVNNTYTFHPALGGITLDAGTEIFPWTGGAEISLLNVSASGDTLTTKWEMRYGSDFVLYDYKLYISGKTLTVEAAAHNPKAMRLTFDRSEGTLNPKIIPIPYLPLFNVLYTDDNAGNKVFVSSFFDWKETNASGIYPFDFTYSSTSAAYAQYVQYAKNTNGERNLLNEKIYITVSPSLTDVLPTIPNPASTYKQTSSCYLVWDSWHYHGFADALNDLTLCRNAGIDNLWVIIHDWQNAGYDNAFPDVIPANDLRGGSFGLNAISNFCAENSYLFSLHENYVDFYPNAPSYNTADLSKDENSNIKEAWYNPDFSVQSYQMKPAKMNDYLDVFSPQIHSLYATNASYLDVHTATNPSYLNDHDADIPNSNTINQVIEANKELLASLRFYHEGPVSGEGFFHFLYAGHLDDAEAQINTGKSESGYWQGVRLPLLVDFKLNKIHPLMVSHGVGYYERFFSNTDGSSFFHPFSLDSVLIYIATELAYGNAGFIPFKDRTANYLQTALLEHTYVLPAQRLYANATVLSISYDDNGKEVDASQYIKNHPATFDNIDSPDFMSKVKISYDNGTVVYANRHPSQNWIITPDVAEKNSFNFHAIIKSTDSLGITADTDITTWTLPPQSGWLVISPSSSTTELSGIEDSQQSIHVYPSLNNGRFTIASSRNGDRKGEIEIYNILGLNVFQASDITLNVPFSVDISEQTDGIYFVCVKIGKEQYRQKIILRK